MGPKEAHGPPLGDLAVPPLRAAGKALSPLFPPAGQRRVGRRPPCVRSLHHRQHRLSPTGAAVPLLVWHAQAEEKLDALTKRLDRERKVREAAAEGRAVVNNSR